MSWEKIEKWIWRRWKANKTLPTIAKELSNKTRWSGYYSLCFIVDYLHNRKGIGFSRNVLRYAFKKFLDDVSPDRKEAWAWLLSLGGFKFERGKNSHLSNFKNTPILSSLKVNLPDNRISKVKEYNYTYEGLKSSQGANLIIPHTPEREALHKGELPQEV